MRGLVIVSRDDHGVAHDGSAGVSPEGWLPDRVSVGALTRAFPPDLVDRVVATTDSREIRRRLLPARLVVYFVLALWLFRGPNCGYGRVMVKLVDALYHRRRGQQLAVRRAPEQDRRSLWVPETWLMSRDLLILVEQST